MLASIHNIYIYYGDISYIPYIFGDIPSITPGTMGPSLVLPFFGSVGSAQVELDELHSKYQELHDAMQAKTDGGREILLFAKDQECHGNTSHDWECKVYTTYIFMVMTGGWSIFVL